MNLFNVEFAIYLMIQHLSLFTVITAAKIKTQHNGKGSNWWKFQGMAHSIRKDFPKSFITPEIINGSTTSMTDKKFEKLVQTLTPKGLLILLPREVESRGEGDISH